MEEGQEIITLVDENGEKFEFLMLDHFTVEDLDYVILLPLSGEVSSSSEEDNGEFPMEVELEENEDEAVIFRIIKGEDDETILHVIEDEEEWENVAEIAYERLMASEDEE